MTKQRLKMYCKLKQEIEVLIDRISAAELYGTDAVIDVVHSAAEFPYKKHDTVIKGFGSSSLPRLRARLHAKRQECEAIENFVNSVDDSIMWQLLTRRYIEGRSLFETADLVGYSPNHASRLIENFLKDDRQ